MKLLLIGVIGLLAGLIVSRTFLPNEPTNTAAIPEVRPESQSPAETEALLIEMRETRDELQTLLQTERDRFAELSVELEGLIDKVESQPEYTIAPSQENSRRENRNLGQTSYGIDTLVDAGLTEVESERVLALEAEARDRVQELLADPENRNRNAIREAVQEVSSQIRSELGDYSYETYLNATGRSTSVSVGAVEAQSAGAVAGIAAGDQIVSYAGQRVFDISDLQSVTTSGTEGETVVVELIRDEQPVTLVMPRGEIGISTRGRRER